MRRFSVKQAAAQRPLRCPPCVRRRRHAKSSAMSTSRRRTGVHSLLFQRELTGRRRSDLLLWSRELMYGSGRSASYIPLPETAKSTIALAFSADGEYFASTHGDHTVKVRPPLPSPGNARGHHRDAPPNPGPHHAPACTTRSRGRARGGAAACTGTLAWGRVPLTPRAPPLAARFMVRVRVRVTRRVKRRSVASPLPPAPWAQPSPSPQPQPQP